MPGFARELIRSRGRHTCIIHAYLVEREFARVEGGGGGRIHPGLLPLPVISPFNLITGPGRKIRP